MASRGLAKAVAPLASAHCAPLMALRLETTWIFREALFTTPFWRSVQKPDYPSMRWGVLNGLPENEAEALYEELIPESGRTLFEFALWFLDRRRAAFIEQGSIHCPMLFLTGDQDRLTPIALCKRNAEFHGRVAQFEVLPGHAHWLPSEPGWESIAERTLNFFEMQHAQALRAAA
jgi:pimeloyl-ACP methyl ester carboxylesterase